MITATLQDYGDGQIRLETKSRYGDRGSMTVSVFEFAALTRVLAPLIRAGSREFTVSVPDAQPAGADAVEVDPPRE